MKRIENLKLKIKTKRNETNGIIISPFTVLFLFSSLFLRTFCNYEFVRKRGVEIFS
jgi:hypothetical protein